MRQRIREFQEVRTNKQRTWSCESEQDDRRMLNGRCSCEGQAAVRETENTLWATLRRAVNVLTKDLCRETSRVKVLQPFPLGYTEANSEKTRTEGNKQVISSKYPQSDLSSSVLNIISY